MTSSVPLLIFDNFLGAAPRWYKTAILTCLLVNPVVLAAFGPFVAGWLLVGQFIFTLAMALRCYPLQPGGLLALEAVALGLAAPDAVYRETTQNFSVILLLMFMVAGIHFLRDLLLVAFSALLLKVRSQKMLAVLFCASAALLSAFLDALTVMAVMIGVGAGFYGIFHRLASNAALHKDHEIADDDKLADEHRDNLERFRGFLRGLLMHGAVGTALGGVATLVGEPQNLVIGAAAGWNFPEFFMHMAPVSLPAIAAGLLTCLLLEQQRWFGYGEPMPAAVRQALEDWAQERKAARSRHQQVQLWAQAIVAVLLVLGLALHVAEVGLIGLTVIVLATAFCGIVEEKRLGHAFEEALPFTALLVTFFAIVTVIHEQHLFKPLIDQVLALEGRFQLAVMFAANGVLSAISDNVFVATVYISEIKQAFDAGQLSRSQFELLAIAVNAGTNLPSVATPNGQAAFLFLLTSSLAPLIHLGYGRMIWMALPYTITLSVVGLIATVVL